MEFGNVGAGSEGLVARAAQHDAAQAVIGAQIAHGAAKLRPHRLVERVHAPWIGQRDGSHAAIALDEDFAAHVPRAKTSRIRLIPPAMSGQRSRTRAREAIVPTRPLDQNTRISPSAPIIDSRKESSARLPSTSASVNGASGMPIFLNT